MKAVIVSPDIIGPVKNGGIGTFCTNLALLLRKNNHDVCIVFTSTMSHPRSEWQRLYDAHDIEVIHAYEPHNSGRLRVGYPWFVHESHVAARHIPDDADIVYMQDWRGNGSKFLRDRRFKKQGYPICALVVHSPSVWVRDGMQVFPDDVEEHLGLDYIERYAARHSDMLVSPSHYMLNWIKEDGWKIPGKGGYVLGYPYEPTQPVSGIPAPASHFQRIVFFGRLETRKGLELFIEALIYLREALQYRDLSLLEEIVLLGKDEKQHTFGELEPVLVSLRQQLGVNIRAITTFDTYQAQEFLAAHAADSLVVMPSLVDNLPYAVIEASLIPGLNLITSDNGGMAEILGSAGDGQLFAPHVKPFADTLKAWLEQGPRPHTQLGHYDWQRANRNWLAFQEKMVDMARHARQKAPRNPHVNGTSPAVDICVPFYNHAVYLPQVLEALAHQTTGDFKVYVINDASTDPNANLVFDEMAARYAEPHWTFWVNTQNEGLSETRNIAARLGQADYLIFVDSDNVPLPHMVERLLEAIRFSGDDCLTCQALAFESDSRPYEIGTADTPQNIEPAVDVLYEYYPYGGVAELGLFTNSFGDANFIIRRETFEAIGGFDVSQAHYRHIVGEDHALLADLVLHGYSVDVVPEFLFFYRYRQSSLLRSTNQYMNMMRVQNVYRTHLQRAGLEHLVPLIYGLYVRAEQLPGSINYAHPEWLANRVPWFSLRDAFFLKLRKHIPPRWWRRDR